MTRVYLTTTIPFVNAPPHLGFALEAVQADVLARHHRHRGDETRLTTGTDDNSLKNVLAAEAAGVAVQDWVDRHAAAIANLREPLALSNDDFIRTSSDPRHRPGVDRFWRACAAAGDLYRGHYTGLYCVGCEAYFTADELVDGRCPEHGTEPQAVSEPNWFFRLSSYAEPLRDAITSGRLRIEPDVRRNEVLALIEGGLHDFAISRSRERARGWGIPVPDDPDQVIYVWWDALGNYITSLDYGTAGAAFDRWWRDSDRRVHVVGKGVLRFHAVYWPAMLLSAGLPLPTEIFVHDYLTIDGKKISKSTGGGGDPIELVGRYGTDAVRWWLLREVPPVGDVDFTEDRLIARANADLAGGFGNLVNRVVTMIHRYRGGIPPTSASDAQTTAPDAQAATLVATCRGVGNAVDAALRNADFRAASAAVWEIVTQANRYIEKTRPWELARTKHPDGEARTCTNADLDAVLATLLDACRHLATELTPFLPGAAAAIAGQCTPDPDGRLPEPRPLFLRIAGTMAP
jgi:methionyl-tRNA synthetase